MQNLKNSLLLLLAAVVVSVFAIAPAQAKIEAVSVNIPFDFVVGSKTLPAGAYRIRTEGAFLALVDSAGKTKYVLALPDDPQGGHNGEPYLRFSRYGNRSFLTGVVFSEDNAIRLPRSSQEKEMMAQKMTNDQLDLSTGGSR